MKSSLIIQASNIHNGGGRTLLIQLLSSIPVELKTLVLVDSRIGSFHNLSSNISIRYIGGKLIQRFLAELWLLRNARAEDSILCFGNLPPLFSLAGRSTVFVQNRYLIDPVGLGNLSLRLRLRLSIERLWFFWRGSNVDQFVVQTPTMFNLMKEKASRWRGAVKILPFCDQPKCYSRMKSVGKSNHNCEVDFIYIASGEAHKNHAKLIDAWCNLAIDGLFPSLWLTISEKNEPQLCSLVSEKINAHKLRITNLGIQPPTEIHSLYKRAKALIYPSTFESFGLPLVEARQAGISIVASELDFVRDVIDPDETFDPQSSISIARAVKRFMGWSEVSLPLVNADEFLRFVIEKREDQ